MHWERRAASRADWTAGSRSDIRTAMMAITTSSSISVKPFRHFCLSIIEGQIPLNWEPPEQKDYAGIEPSSKEDSTPKLNNSGISKAGYLGRVRRLHRNDYRRTLTGIGTGRFLDEDTLNMSAKKEPAARTKPFNMSVITDINIEGIPRNGNLRFITLIPLANIERNRCKSIGFMSEHVVMGVWRGRTIHYCTSNRLFPEIVSFFFFKNMC